MPMRHGPRAVAVMLAGGAILALSACVDDAGPATSMAAGQICPQWAKFPLDHHDNAASAYLGCTSAANLRAQLVDPADLERGRSLASANGERETLAVEAYEQGKVKAFQGTSASGAGSSQAGASSSGGGASQ